MFHLVNPSRNSLRLILHLTHKTFSCVQLIRFPGRCKGQCLHVLCSLIVIVVHKCTETVLGLQRKPLTDSFGGFVLELRHKVSMSK